MRGRSPWQIYFILSFCLSWVFVSSAGLLPGCSSSVDRDSSGEKGEKHALLDEALHLLHRGRTSEAEGLLDSLPGSLDALTDEEKLSTITAFLCRASLLEKEQDLAGAEELLNKAYETLCGIPGSHEKKLASILIHRANILARLGRVDASEACLADALKAARSAKSGGSRIQSLVFQEQEKLLHQSGNYEKELREAIQQYENQLGPDHPYVARGLYHLALSMEEKGRHSDAEQYFLRSMAIHEKLLGAGHPVIATFLNHLATMFRNNEEFEKARHYLMRMIAIYEETLQQVEPERIQALKTMTYRTQVDVTPMTDSLIRLDEKNFGPTHPNVARSLRYYAMLHESKGQHSQAESMIRRALRIYLEHYPPENEEVIFARKRLAACLSAQNKEEEAVRLARETLNIEEKVHGKDHPSTMPSRYSLAIYLEGAGKFQEAEAHLQSLRDSFESGEGVSGDFIHELETKLIDVYMRLGKEEEAGSLRKQIQESRRSATADRQSFPTCPRSQGGE